MILSQEQRRILEPRLLENRRFSGDCWLWTKSCTSKGYGQIFVNDKNLKVHRLAAALWLGFDLDSELFIIHSCDTPRCFNPDHLREATAAENTQDMMGKGRNRSLTRKGEKNKWSKVDEQDVREIRLLRTQGMTFASIGERYGLTSQGIGKICRRATWGHVE